MPEGRTGLLQCEGTDGELIRSQREEIARLAKRLEDAEWASRKTNEGIKVLYRELEQKNEKLTELDRLKTQFVATVSHEFRSPLAVVKQFLSIILEGMAGEVTPKQREMLESSEKTVDRLVRLVGDLLDLSKIESGKMEMHRELVDMPRLVEQILADYEIEALRKEMTLVRDVPAEAGGAWGDRDKLSQVIINLVANAIKYTPAGGTVTARLRGDGKDVRFEVSDTGPGIPREAAQRIFDKFERITAEKQEGTGLGLSVAREIVELHRGRIWVESEFGKGSTFIFTVPRDLRGGKRQQGSGKTGT